MTATNPKPGNLLVRAWRWVRGLFSEQAELRERRMYQRARQGQFGTHDSQH